MELILASTSPARRALLDGLGLPCRAVAPEVDETHLPGESAPALVARLAQAKAQAVSQRFPGAWVLGADQVVALGDDVFNKPASRDAARAQLTRLSGTTHSLHTGVHLTNGAHTGSAVESAHLTLHPLSAAQLERYLDTEEWRGCAGSYRVEGRGQLLMARIEGDRTNIQGLPMLTVCRLLREALGPDLI